MSVAIPTFQDIMLPFLRALGDGKEHPFGELNKELEDSFRLSPEERAQLLPSGGDAVFKNRVGWVRTYFKKALLIEAVRRGVFRITERGRALLAERPERIDSRLLARYPEFVAFQASPPPERAGQDGSEGTTPTESTPVEQMERGYAELRSQVAQELLERIRQGSPEFFEHLVVDVLLRMGYGGARGAGLVTGQSGDQGIDGIISEDRLGLDLIYVQAKRWSGPVGRPAIHAFMGALGEKHADRGVFITTSTFTAEARESVQRGEKRVVLLDGQALVYLMIDHGVGVSEVRKYSIWRIDTDYFVEED